MTKGCRESRFVDLSTFIIVFDASALANIEKKLTLNLPLVVVDILNVVE